MDKTLCGARIYAAGLFVLGVDRYDVTVAHSVAAVFGVAAVALWLVGTTIQPLLQRPYLRLAAVCAAVAGGAAVFQLLEQWRDPDVYSWIAAPLVLTGAQAAIRLPLANWVSMMLFEPPKGRLFYWRAVHLASPSLIRMPNLFSKKGKIWGCGCGRFW